MLSLSEAGWIAISGMAVAFIGGGFTFAGVVVSVLNQRQPATVTADTDPHADCRRELAEMIADRNHWREVANHFIRLHGQRHDDPPHDDGGASIDE